jgi:hypothetical protein
MTLAYFVGYGVIAASLLCNLASIVLVARASLVLRSKVGSQCRTGRLLGIAARSVVPGRLWRKSGEPINPNDIERFRRQIWVALVLLAVPLVVTTLVRSLYAQV